MQKIWFISPSSQSANIGVGDYGSEQEQMNLLADAIIPHLDRAGVSFHRANPDLSLGQRVDESNEMGVFFHLALHSNAGGKGLARGPVAYYYSDAGKVFGEKVVSKLLALGQENNRNTNVKQDKTLYELKKTLAPACLLEVDFHDSISGVEFLVSHREKIAEVIAKAIIETDGKQFVPITPGEYVDKALSLGLFPQGTQWNTPLTKEEAAALAVKLIELLRRG